MDYSILRKSNLQQSLTPFKIIPLKKTFKKMPGGDESRQGKVRADVLGW